MHQPTLLKWADLLGPLFPTDAAIDLRPQQSRISVRWLPIDPAGASATRDRVVAIQIAPEAIKTYRNAQRGQQARADRKLFAFVHSSLKRAHPAERAGEPEMEIVVASLDILPR